MRVPRILVIISLICDETPPNLPLWYCLILTSFLFKHFRISLSLLLIWMFNFYDSFSHDFMTMFATRISTFIIAECDMSKKVIAFIIYSFTIYCFCSTNVKIRNPNLCRNLAFSYLYEKKKTKQKNPATKKIISI